MQRVPTGGAGEQRHQLEAMMYEAVGRVTTDSAGTRWVDVGVTADVRPGRTLEQISSDCKVPLAELMRLNPELERGLDGGMRLRIPLRYRAEGRILKSLDREGSPLL